MPFTLNQQLAVTTSDDEVFKILAAELQRRLPHGTKAEDAFIREIRAFPKGLRAMAATYELDVSLALDDLGWHFGNWHHRELAQETVEGLRELEAGRMAELFADAFVLAQEYWEELRSKKFTNWYHGSPLEKSLEPLNREAYNIWSGREKGLFSYWISYARQHPERLV